MSIGHNVNTTLIQLQYLRHDIRQETLKLITSGKAKNIADPANAHFYEKLENWRSTLEECQMRLAQMMSSVAGQRGLVPPGTSRLPFEARRDSTYRRN